jgi:hypothetical protein
MSRSPCEMTCGPAQTLGTAWQASCKGTWMSARREAALNWLALGLLLAAWNASDDGSAAPSARRPTALRGYSSVSVRAATLHAPEVRAVSSQRT